MCRCVGGAISSSAASTAGFFHPQMANSGQGSMHIARYVRRLGLLFVLGNLGLSGGCGSGAGPQADPTKDEEIRQLHKDSHKSVPKKPELTNKRAGHRR
jgi:hypothetical protein